MAEETINTSLTITKEELIELLKNTNNNSSITVNISITDNSNNQLQQLTPMRHPKLPGSILVNKNGDYKYVILDAKYRKIGYVKEAELIDNSTYLDNEYSNLSIHIPPIQVLEDIYRYSDAIDLLDLSLPLNKDNALGSINPYGFWHISDEHCSIGTTTEDINKKYKSLVLLDKYGNVVYHPSDNNIVSYVFIYIEFGNIRDF